MFGLVSGDERRETNPRETTMMSTCGKFEIETVMVGKRTTYNIWCLATGLVIERAWSMEMAQLKAMRAGAEF